MLHRMNNKIHKTHDQIKNGVSSVFQLSPSIESIIANLRTFMELLWLSNYMDSCPCTLVNIFVRMFVCRWTKTPRRFVLNKFAPQYYAWKKQFQNKWSWRIESHDLICRAFHLVAQHGFEWSSKIALRRIDSQSSVECEPKGKSDSFRSPI